MQYIHISHIIFFLLRYLYTFLFFVVVVAALNDDQDDESNDVSEYDVEIRTGLSTGTRHFSLYFLHLIKHTFQGVCFRFWPISGEAFFRI